jgi:hypothetical protein
VDFVRLALAFKQTPYGTGLSYIQHKWQMTAVTGSLRIKVYGQHIGIVGGSAPGAALCYQTICTEAAALI